MSLPTHNPHQPFDGTRTIFSGYVRRALIDTYIGLGGSLSTDAAAYDIDFFFLDYNAKVVLADHFYDAEDPEWYDKVFPIEREGLGYLAINRCQHRPDRNKPTSTPSDKVPWVYYTDGLTISKRHFMTLGYVQPRPLHPLPRPVRNYRMWRNTTVMSRSMSWTSFLSMAAPSPPMPPRTLICTYMADSALDRGFIRQFYTNDLRVVWKDIIYDWPNRLEHYALAVGVDNSIVPSTSIATANYEETSISFLEQPYPPPTDPTVCFLTIDGV
ncbi:hypothetical protein C8J57DRAFT_1243285 [Mycena rebaudengoi]|nr:hypothetical protein C8J57DRAFT_1243285 [Mycena rebaudengoi]